jgi:hypothetical protein
MRALRTASRIEAKSRGLSASRHVLDRDGRNDMSPNKIQIPKSVRTEHDAIHDTLKEATRATGRVGPAAQRRLDTGSTDSRPRNRRAEIVE